MATTDPEKRKAIWQRYSAKYKARRRELDQQRRMTEGDRLRAAYRQYYQENIERERARSKAYRDRHPEKRKAIDKRWVETNPDKAKARSKRRHRRERAAHVEYFPEWETVLLADPCAFCGATSTTIDHIDPLRKGGAHAVDNAIGTCRSCNSSKGTKTLLQFLMH